MSTRTVAVTGSASAAVEPAYATVTVSIDTDGATASEAHTRLLDRREEVVAALARDGISRESLSTTYLSLSEPGDFGPVDHDGYCANTKLQFRCVPQDLDRLAASVADAGGLIHTTELDIDENTGRERYHRLLAEAVANARERAESLATAEGEHVGAVRSIDLETGNSFDSLVEDAMGASREADLSAGPIELQASVDCVFELEVSR